MLFCRMPSSAVSRPLPITGHLLSHQSWKPVLPGGQFCPSVWVITQGQGDGKQGVTVRSTQAGFLQSNHDLLKGTSFSTVTKEKNHSENLHGATAY